VLVNEFKDLYSPGIGKPELVLTFTLSQTPHQTTRKTIWTFKGVKIGREEWPEMLTKIPEEIVQQPISNETPAPQGLFLPTGQTYVKIKEPEKMEEDTLYLFGVDPKILGRSLSKSNLEEKVKLLLERGTRMSEEDLASVKKMKVNFQKKDDIKFFLDEVLRVGNLWLYNAICHLLKEHEPAVEADRGDVCFKLSVKGNWQEYRDSVDAFVKVKVYLPKTLTEVAMVSGSMSI